MENEDLRGEFIIRSRLSNKMTGRFVLYGSGFSEIESKIFIKKLDSDDLKMGLSVRAPDDNEKNATIDIKYRGNDEVESTIQAIASSNLEASIEVRPHNRMFGRFELHEAPRIEVNLPPVADATTRSRSDLQTINYGDTNSMLIGKNLTESFESFVRFADLNSQIPDLKILESVKLRVYYIESPQDTVIELHQPNTLWHELGVTHANRPHSVELLTNKYLINTQERYIEFDVFEIAKRWQTETLSNFGFIIKTSDNRTISFYTRESNKPPLLLVKYITSQIYSIGRELIDSTLFVYGKKDTEISGSITVHSTVGIETQESTLYVHRREDPMFSEKEAIISSTRAAINSEMTVAIREHDEIIGFFTVYENNEEPLISDIYINNPDLPVWFTVDPNISLKSFLTVAQNDDSNLLSDICINTPELSSFLTVDPQMSLPAMITIGRNEEESLESEISISRREIEGFFEVRAYGEDEIISSIDIPYYEELNSDIIISSPELISFLEVKEYDQIDGEIWVKEKDYLDAIIDIKKVDELSSTLIVKTFDEIESELIISVPDLYSTIQPRVIGYEDLEMLASIRKRDASDIDSFLYVSGSGTRSYWFIM